MTQEEATQSQPCLISSTKESRLLVLGHGQVVSEAQVVSGLGHHQELFLREL